MSDKTMTPRECPVAHYHMPRTCAAGLIETCPNRAPSHEAELREALETLVLLVGLTAFTYEGQRKPLQEAVDRARAALQKVGVT